MSSGELDGEKCYLCNLPPKIPVQMKCCKTILCKKCFSAYMRQNNQCPFCHKKHDGVVKPARFLRVTQKDQKEEKENPEICPKHKKPFAFVCQTCKTYICSDCLYDVYLKNDSTHEGHTIVKIENKAALIQDKIDALNSKKKEITSIIKDLEIARKNATKLLDSITSNHNEIKIDMYAAFRSFQGILSDTTQKKQDKIMLHLQELSGMLTDVAQLIDEAEIILRSDDPAVYDSALYILNRLREFHDKLPSMEYQEEILPAESYLVPVLQSATFEIPNFEKAQEDAKKSPTANFIYSPIITLYDLEWRAKIYPAGNGHDTHLGLYVEIVSAVEEPIEFYYQVEVVHPRGGEPLERHYVSAFNKLDAWGWTKMVPIAAIEADYTEGGAVQFRLNIRPVSYEVAVRLDAMLLRRKRAQYKAIKADAEKRGLLKNLPREAGASEKESDLSSDDVDSF